MWSVIILLIMWGNPQKRLVDKQGENMAKRNDVGLAFVVGVLLLAAVYVGAVYLHPAAVGVPSTGAQTTVSPTL